MEYNDKKIDLMCLAVTKCARENLHQPAYTLTEIDTERKTISVSNVNGLLRVYRYAPRKDTGGWRLKPLEIINIEPSR